MEENADEKKDLVIKMLTTISSLRETIEDQREKYHDIVKGIQWLHGDIVAVLSYARDILDYDNIGHDSLISKIEEIERSTKDIVYEHT